MELAHGGLLRTVVVVGIGAGDPGLVTAEALSALGEVDVVIGFEKGERARELRAVRDVVLERARTGRACRVVDIADARRDERYDLNLWIGHPLEGATYLPR